MPNLGVEIIKARIKRLEEINARHPGLQVDLALNMEIGEDSDHLVDFVKNSVHDMRLLLNQIDELNAIFGKVN